MGHDTRYASGDPAVGSRLVHSPNGDSGYSVAAHGGSFDSHNPDHQRGALLAFGHVAEPPSSGPSAAPGLAGPPRIDLGDRAVGTSHFEDLFVFNTEATGAAVRVTYDGPPAIVIASSPATLRPSRDGFDPNSAIRLHFAPTAKAHYPGTLVIDATWQSGTPSQQLRIPVIAAAHDVGQPDLATEEATERERARDHQRAENAARKAQHDRQAHDDNVFGNHMPGTPALREDLLAAAFDAGKALSALMETRVGGVRDAADEAALFKRRVPATHHSVLESLAMAAIEVATAAIGGSLAKAIEQALHDKLAGAGDAPSKAALGFIVDGFKDTFKRGTKAALEHPGEGGNEPAPASVSDDARIDFFGVERNAVIGESDIAAHDIIEDVRYALEPQLATAPEAALGTMRTIASEARKARQHEVGQSTQKRESALHWMRYVSHASMGSVGEGRAANANIAAGNAAPDRHGAPKQLDGLVNLEFTGDVSHAERPAELKRVHVNGVSNAVATHLAQTPLLAAGVPIRAYGVPTTNHAVLPLEAIRDESGRVECRDESGAGGTPANWFARKAGDPGGGRDAQLRGAAKVLEELAEQFPQHCEEQQAQPVETDSAD